MMGLVQMIICLIEEINKGELDSPLKQFGDLLHAFTNRYIHNYSLHNIEFNILCPYPDFNRSEYIKIYPFL